MRRLHILLLLALVPATSGPAALPATGQATTGPAVVPLPSAHAHNDYEHPRPLLDALDHGFCSVEADVFLVGGKLLVAHNRLGVRPDRTLGSLYLDPLRERADANGGRIYPGGPTLVLLVDLKTAGETTWPAVRDVLKAYAPILTSWTDGKKQERAVTVILTGDVPRAAVAADSAAAAAVRYAACDGRLPDLDASPPPPVDLVPLVSSGWRKTFAWRGAGPMPEPDRRKLRELAAKAHAQGRTIRFWAAPDNAAAWAEQQSAGVDLINTDDLKGLRAFLTVRRGADAAVP